FVIVIYAGFAGVQSPPEANLIPTVVYVLFWVGIPVLSVLFGDVFRAFNPWLAIGRGVGWAVNRLGVGADPLPYPRRLGRWPAASLGPVPGTGPLLSTIVVATSFDGFSQGAQWSNANGRGLQLQHRFLDLGLSAEHAQEAAFTVGLVGVVLIISGLYRLGVLG